MKTRHEPIILCGALVASGIACWSACAAVNLLPNGSFEDGAFTAAGGVMALGNGDRSITGWQVVGGSSGSGISWMDNSNPYGYKAADGSRFLNLVGGPAGADGAGVELALGVPVVPGQYYQLSFDLGVSAQDHVLYADPTGLTGPGVQVTVTGISGALASGNYYFGNTSNPNTDGDNSWELVATAPFEATGASTTVIFSSVGYGGEHFLGLDDVSLVQVPEPSAAVLITMGVLGLALSVSLRLAARLSGLKGDSAPFPCPRASRWIVTGSESAGKPGGCISRLRQDHAGYLRAFRSSINRPNSSEI
jgi:hypothetical protein